MQNNNPQPEIGIAYNNYVHTLLDEAPDCIDYVEVPFELLCHDPSVIKIMDRVPIVLHCASLSLAGSVRPKQTTVAAIKDIIDKTQTKWVGEHLSYITAERTEAGVFPIEYAPGEPYNIGYTVSPPYNDQSLEIVLKSIEAIQSNFDVPFIIENAPTYFVPPGSTMTQMEFIKELAQRSNIGLLLDLAHFYISADTLKYDPFEALEKFALEQVREIHISGVHLDQEQLWDNHAEKAPPIIYDLLSLALERANPWGITLEYNWSSKFPMEDVFEEIEQVRNCLI
jgi:uncharacterized protein (UPF0276 family)